MVDVVVIGAGPAGMAGAIEAADAGLDVLVIDEQARAGGQIFRRPPATFDVSSGSYAPYSWAANLIERFETHSRISTAFRSTVYGIFSAPHDFDGNRFSVGVMGLNGPGTSGTRISCQRVLIATGAYDMPVAFPGWTTPGVVTVGAVQSLLKSQKVLAGQKVVLAGSHPLLLIAAEQLLAAGADIAEIAFARGIPGPAELVRALPAAPNHLAVFVEAARAAKAILRHRVRVSTRTIVTKAHGDTVVEGVNLSRIDRNWKPKGLSREVEADLLAIGYGFSPSTELARQIGCDMVWDSPKGGWIVAHNEDFETTVPGVFVAGEPCGVAGAEQSRAAGTMAGLKIAGSLGKVDESQRNAERRARKRIRTATRFSKVVQQMFEPNRGGLAALSQPSQTVVCRCELITSGEIDELLDKNSFISSANALKLEGRTGMGPCQGRNCENAIAARVAQARNHSLERSGYFTAHVPVKPVPLSAYETLADTCEE
ncbi:NAD(P)/FAD-dependent oxidoreductase [Pseudoglutamicibacter cumminsii]|uniref:NAD(P)/FAD-dependent oxidoreductase n=1 Tax=Pseudoglutamicibacter cumminsii TaxID=156979 RepID=UPI0025565E6D|nr:NAD(P)/FAD-dependent oxidoreductase [Pseudoglutamicibacter cumminsii]MDZ3744859.1 NAD(P)/FAD-dependent oxidoreductase [Pseudoglutamicibacter cumminsii]